MGMHVLAKVLGIEEPLDEMALVELIRHGLPGCAIDALAKNLEVTITELSCFVHVSSRTLIRHRGKLLDKHLSNHLVTIGTVVARCIELFQSHEKACRWLKSPALALGDCCPLDLLDTWVGSTIILNLLGRIEHGVYS